MKFQIEFDNWGEDDDKLFLLGCEKIHKEEMSYFVKEIKDFDELKDFQLLVEKRISKYYSLLIDMDMRTPIIYLRK